MDSMIDSVLDLNSRELNLMIASGRNLVRDIGSFIFLEPESEKPPISFVGRNQCFRAATLATTSKSSMYLHGTAAQVASIKP